MSTRRLPSSALHAASAMLLALLPLLVGCGRGEPTEEEKARWRAEDQRWRDEQQRLKTVKEESDKYARAQQAADAERLKQQLETSKQADEHKKAEQARKEKEAQEASRKKAEEIAQLVKMGQVAGKLPATAQVHPQQVTPIGLHGTALIYDLQKGMLSDAQAKLPPELQAQAKAGDVYVFVIGKTHLKPVARYTALRKFGVPSADIPGYQAELDIHVVSWRLRLVLGTFKVLGAFPPQNITLGGNFGIPLDPRTNQPTEEIVGDTAAAVAAWVREAFNQSLGLNPTYEKEERLLTGWANLFSNRYAWIGPKEPAWKELSQRLKAASKAPLWQRHAYVQALRNISGKPMGPVSEAQYASNPDDWDRRWREWVERQQAAEGDQLALQGTWELSAIESQGKQGDVQKVLLNRLVISGNVLRETSADDKRQGTAGPFTLQPTAQPSRLEVNAGDPLAGAVKVTGIYRLEKDMLTICWGTNLSQFATAPESPALLKVYRRQTP